MSVILETLQVASFKGVGFFFTGHSEVGGRKSIVFDYPNQDTRFVQDLGKLPRTFNITGTISNQTFEYYTERNNLISALSSEGSGTLIHPYEGPVTAFAKSYTLTESLDAMGVATFEMVFEETGAALYPTTSASFSSNVEAELDNYILTLNEDFAKFWSVDTNNLNNYNYTKDQLEVLGENFNNLPAQVSSSSGSLASFNSTLKTYNDNLPANTLDGSTLGPSINTLFESAPQLTTDTAEQSSLVENFFFYQVDEEIDQTTVGLEERELDRITLFQLINSQALAYDYVFTTQSTFETQTALQAQSDLLNEQFELVVTNNIYTDILGNYQQILSDTTLGSLEDMRSETHAYLRSQMTSEQSVVDIVVPRNSLLPLVYQYYGDVDEAQAIYDLNNLATAVDISGPFKIIEDTSVDIDDEN